ICTAFPHVIPYVGSGTPTFETYHVSHLASAGTPDVVDANAEVSFAVDPAGEVFYVILNPWFSPTSPSQTDATKGGPDYNTMVRMSTKTKDGPTASKGGGDASENRAGFTMFQRTPPTGTCKNELPASPTWYYQALKL